MAEHPHAGEGHGHPGLVGRGDDLGVANRPSGLNHACGPGLDGLDKAVGDEETVHSAPEVRAILERSGKVLTVFMGHSHVNDYRTMNGIHYCTLDAVIGGVGAENNAYSVIEIYPGGDIKLNGFCKHATHPMAQDARR